MLLLVFADQQPCGSGMSSVSVQATSEVVSVGIQMDSLSAGSQAMPDVSSVGSQAMPDASSVGSQDLYMHAAAVVRQMSGPLITP